MSGAYERVTSLAELFARVGELALATLIFDIEPLVAPWDSGQQGLDRGVAEILGQAGTVPSVRAVVFSTNSARRPSALPTPPPPVVSTAADGSDARPGCGSSTSPRRPSRCGSRRTAACRGRGR